MEMDFYRNKLEEYGLEVLTPAKQETRDYIQHTVKEELGIGFVNPETKKNYITIVHELIENGAECIILGCTEIPMLVSQDDFEIPVPISQLVKVAGMQNNLAEETPDKKTGQGLEPMVFGTP